MKKKNLLFLAFTLLSFTAFTLMQSCTPKEKPLEPAQLEGYWVLKTLDGQDAKTLFDGALPTIQFDTKEMRISGTGGCNRYNGAFDLKDNVLNTSKVAVTQMACLGENKESEFLAKLQQANTVSIVNDVLTFTEEGTKVVLEFEKGEAPVELTVFDKLGGTWVLTELEGKAVADIFKGENAKIPTLTFDFDKGIVSGTAGCNNYNAPFKYEGGLIIVSPAGSTKMACPNLQGETQYLSNLIDTMGVSIPDANSLQLRKKGNLIFKFSK